MPGNFVSGRWIVHYMRPNTDPNRQKKPITLSPTPLRDWLHRQSRMRRMGLTLLFALLIACGGKAGVVLSFTPIAATHQVFFALLAGALLGSRLGSISAIVYLLAAAATGLLWPLGAGQAPLLGPMAGYLWSLPLVAYLSGYLVEYVRMEKPAYFAMGACAGIGVFNAAGSISLMAAQAIGAADAYLQGTVFFVGQHFAQGALTVMIASSASATIQAREKK